MGSEIQVQESGLLFIIAKKKKVEIIELSNNGGMIK